MSRGWPTRPRVGAKHKILPLCMELQDSAGARTFESILLYVDFVLQGAVAAPATSIAGVDVRSPNRPVVSAGVGHHDQANGLKHLRPRVAHAERMGGKATGFHHCVLELQRRVPRSNDLGGTIWTAGKTVAVRH